MQGKKALQSEDKRWDIVEELSQAILSADIAKVKMLLSEDVQSISDGGNNVSAARNILHGSDRVYKLLNAIWHKYCPEADMKFGIVNHKPALLSFLGDQLIRCMVFEIAGNKISAIYVIINPDKLLHLNILH